jgi:predicted Zn-dependent protease
MMSDTAEPAMRAEAPNLLDALAEADAAYAVVWSELERQYAEQTGELRAELERITAEVERLRSEYAQAVEDWGRNDALVLADSQRLAEEVARLRALLDDIERMTNSLDPASGTARINTFKADLLALLGGAR